MNVAAFEWLTLTLDNETRAAPCTVALVTAVLLRGHAVVERIMRPRSFLFYRYAWVPIELAPLCRSIIRHQRRAVNAGRVCK